MKARTFIVPARQPPRQGRTPASGERFPPTSGCPRAKKSPGLFQSPAIALQRMPGSAGSAMRGGDRPPQEARTRASVSSRRLVALRKVRLRDGSRPPPSHRAECTDGCAWIGGAMPWGPPGAGGRHRSGPGVPGRVSRRVDRCKHSAEPRWRLLASGVSGAACAGSSISLEATSSAVIALVQL